MGDARASLGLTWFLHLMVLGYNEWQVGKGQRVRGWQCPAGSCHLMFAWGRPRYLTKKFLFTALPTQQSLNWKVKTLGALSTPNKQWVLGFKEHVTVTLMAHFACGGMEGSPKVKRLN